MRIFGPFSSYASQNDKKCKKCGKYFDVSNYCDKICHIGDKNVTKSKPSQTAWLCGF